MPKNSENLNRQLFDLLKSKGYSPSTLDTSGKETPVPEEAEVFQFDFTKNGEDYGKVTVSIDGLHKLIIYFGDDVANSSKENTGDTLSGGDSWYALLKQLKKFAKNRQLSFELQNSNHLKHDMAKREYMKNKEKISEGYYPMGKKASYSDSVPNVKIVIEHTRQIEEGEQRYRNVNRIFVENQLGERFLLDTKQPGIARVYARHIAEGGKVNDERWGHINSLCEEYSKMSGFVRAVRNGQFNESAQQLVQKGVSHYQSLRESLSKMTGHRGYTAYFESWTPSLMEDETDTSSLNELFVQETLDPRIENVMPILSKLHQQVAEMKEVDALAEWADSLTENSGLEAINPQGIPEGRLDGSSDIDSPVADAVTRRILMRHPDLLAKFGPEKVSDAIAQVADYVGDFIGPDDEIGSSDVSGWVKQVQGLLVDPLEEGEPGDLEHELERQDYESDGERDRLADLSKINSKTLQSLHALHRHYGQKDPRSKEAAGRGAEELKKRGIVVPTDESVEEGLGDVAKKVGGAVKAGAKAVGKAIVGPDDEELLQNLKKAAGVRNPQTGKPSMAYSDVEKVDEVAKWRTNPDAHYHDYDSDQDYSKKRAMGDFSDTEDELRGRTYKDVENGKLTKGGSDYRKQYIKRSLGKHPEPNLPEDVTEDVATTMPMRDAVNYLRKYGADNFKTTTNELHFYKNGRPFSVDLVLNPDTTRSVTISSLNAARRGLTGQGVAEDLDANQKRVGQLGPTEKVGKKGAVGKLVGANESVELSEMDSEGYKGTRDDGDSKGPEGKAKPIKGKDFAKAAEKTLNKQMDKAHKKDVKESQDERPYVCVHVKKGKCEVTATSSYGAAQKAAQKWGLKSTAGIDVHLADKPKDPASIGESKEGQEDLDAILRIIRK